jgi:type III pantothenate kinase
VVEEEVSACERVAPDDESAVAAALERARAACPAPRRLAACSVNPAGLAVLESAAGRMDEPVLLVGRDLPAPIETNLPEPGAIGPDRLCAAAMAFHRLGQACVVADFGTAITVDCVDDGGVFRGGAILPGLRLSARALHEGTAVLPEVEPVAPEWVFGRNTAEAIGGGLVYAARGALRELTEAYATELGSWPLLIVTGGDAELVAAGYEFVQAVVADLTLLGVALACRRGVGPPR